MHSNRVPTGIPGLDRVLKGGFIKGSSCLIKGGPGTGKTLIGLHFLAEGIKRGERSVFVTFDEKVEDIRKQAEDFGLEADEIEYVDMFSKFSILDADIVLWDQDTKSEILDFLNVVEEETQEADRIFIDGIGVISDCVRDSGLGRRIISSVIHKLSGESTLLVSSEAFEELGRGLISYIVGGEIYLERIEKDGKVFRVLNLLKFRGDANIGKHYFNIKQNRVEVYPIIPYRGEKLWRRELIGTGNAELDKMFGGGIYRGSQVLICGKSGVGKTNIGLQLLVERDRKGEKSLIYSFDESKDYILERLHDLFGHDPKDITIREGLPSSIGEFYDRLLRDFNEIRPSVVIVDPINSLESIAESRNEVVNVLSLLQNFFKQTCTLVVYIHETVETVDVFQFSGYGVSQYADYLLFGRFVELEGEMLKAIAVMKNRFGDHERTFRILDMRSGEGLLVGQPLKDYMGLIRGHFQKI